MVVVAGASGFVGRHAVARLRADGHTVRCGTRRPNTAKPQDGSWVLLDVDRADTLDRALAGADALVYLVHQMAGGHTGDLLAQERAAADRVAAAAQRQGLRRIVYLGAPVPSGPPSPHLAARLVTGERLRAGPTPCLELRASMIIGAGSESWTMVRDLALRLPVMLLPRWLKTRTSPVGLRDVVRALAAAVVDPIEGSHAFDLPGPELLSARDILTRTAAIAGFRAVMVPVPVLTPSLSAHWLRLVTRADYDIARQLVDGLIFDLPGQGASYWSRMPEGAPTPLDDVIRAALDEDDVRGLGRYWERAAKWVGTKV
jgi:uncharacterized protein YbjT (DUF2867 family)